MQLPNLRIQLENFITNDIDSETCSPKDENLIEMIIEAQDAGFPECLMDILYRKLGKYDLERVSEVVALPFFQLLCAAKHQ